MVGVVIEETEREENSPVGLLLFEENGDGGKNRGMRDIERREVRVPQLLESRREAAD